MTIRPIPENRDEWLKLRHGFVGGSEIAALFGCQQGYQMSHYTLWQVKAGRIPAPEPEMNDRIEAGIRFEPIIAQWAAHKNGWDIAKGGFAADESLKISSTLDFEIHGHRETEEGLTGPGVLECKSTDWLVWKRTWGGVPPLHIELQLQHQLLASGYAWGAVAVMVSGNELHVWKRRARPKLQEAIKERVAAFWASIEANQPPSVDDTDSTADALKALYFPPQERTTDIPEAQIQPMHEACGMLLAEREAAKASDKRQTACKNLIKVVLAGANRAYVPAPDADSQAFWIGIDGRGAVKITEEKQ